MTKKVYLIHGWDGSSTDNFFPWLENALKKKNFQVENFDMPNSAEPKIEEWVEYLRDNISEIDENTYFVGHSIGCQTIMRFLEKQHKHKMIAGCVFIAPWLDLINLDQEEIEIAHPWINSEIDFSRVKDHVDNILCIFSDDDPNVHLDEAKKFEENLNAKIIIKKSQGHFDEVEEISDILEFIK